MQPSLLVIAVMAILGLSVPFFVVGEQILASQGGDDYVRAHLQQSSIPAALVDIDKSVAQNSFLANSVIFSIWVGVGLLIWLAYLFFVQVFKVGVHSIIRARRRESVVTAGGVEGSLRFLLRILGLLILLCVYVGVIKGLIPFIAMRMTRILQQDGLIHVKTLVGLVAIALAVAVCTYGVMIGLRLLVSRTRVFYGRYYIED